LWALWGSLLILGVILLMQSESDGVHNDELRRDGVTVTGLVIDSEHYKSRRKFDDWILVRFATADGAAIESKLYEDDYGDVLPPIGATVMVRYAPNDPAGRIEDAHLDPNGWTSRTYLFLGIGILVVVVIGGLYLWDATFPERRRRQR